MAKFILHRDFQDTSFLIKSLELSELRLHNDSLYKWMILIPRVAKAVEFIDLSYDNQIKLLGEINLVSILLKKLYRPHKLNLAMLGNITSQLHVHMVCRNKNDPTFPGVVWDKNVPAQPYGKDKLEEEIERIKKIL